MKIKTRHYAYKDGKDYLEYSLINDNGMVVKVLNYGATLEQVLLPTKDGLENVIMSLPSAEDYSKERNFLGGTVGRVVGRIRCGRVKLGDNFLQLPINDGPNHIHGGSGIDTMVWTTKQVQVIQKLEIAQVKFRLVDFDGDNNYPGNLDIEVVYTLNNDNCLEYNIYARSDKLTIFNPTNHVYFRLDGTKSNVKDLQMQVDADYYLPLDCESLPFMGMRSVEDTIFDLRKPVKLGNILDSKDPEIEREHGLNHPFILNNGVNCAKIISSKTNRTMTMTTNAPSIVVYTANHFNHTGIAKNLGQYDGVTLEAQEPPASGSDLNGIILTPQKDFMRTTSWTFDF